MFEFLETKQIGIGVRQQSSRTFSVSPNLLSQCCQRDVVRQCSDNRQMDDFREEERQLQHVGNK